MDVITYTSLNNFDGILSYIELRLGLRFYINFIVLPTVTSNKVPNDRPNDCLLKSLFRLTTRQISKIRITSPLCEGIHRWSVDSLHKGPVMHEAFPCRDITMKIIYTSNWLSHFKLGFGGVGEWVIKFNGLSGDSGVWWGWNWPGLY